MAKQKQTKQQQQKKQPVVSIPKIESISPITSFRFQTIIIVLLGFGIYFNSFNNKYALDDDIVMRLNDYVQEGFGGIGKIMTTDSYDSFFKSMGSSGELSGGRYRPFSILTFAIEQELFGECHGTRMLEIRDTLSQTYLMQTNPNLANKLIAEKAALEGLISQSHEDLAMIRHVVNVLLYILSAVFLLQLLRDYIFKYANLTFVNYKDLAFFATLLFLVHPIHTEVVANVKSRDEILSLLFMILTFIYVFKYTDSKKSQDLYLGLSFYFLALLSKEWGITLVAIIPMMFFIFKKYSIPQSIKASLPYFAVAAFYMMLRYKFVGAGKQGEITEVLNNPFVFATALEAKATHIFILLKYIRLLIFPHPLSADYSWKTIPYNNFGDALVWVSLMVHTFIVYYFFKFLKNRNWMAFALAFYLFHLFMISNLLMPIGATMGERLVYHSSLGFVMIAAYGILFLLYQFIKSENARKVFYVTIILALIIPMSYKTIDRNPDWETDNILFMHDAWVVPNSVLANGNSGKAFIEYAQKDSVNRLALLDSAIYHLEKAVTLHPKYVNGYLNLGLAYFQKRDLDKAEQYWGLARKYFPSHPFFRQSYDPALANALVERARQEGQKGNIPKAIEFMSRALHYDSTSAQTWYHYGGANYSVGNVKEAYRGWSKCLQLDPSNVEAKKGLDVILQQRNAVPLPVSAPKNK